MENCIFCQIVAGTIPAAKVYEDEQVVAFLDITQVTPGHTLIIPKQHVRNLLDMPDTTASTLFANVPKIARALTKATGAQGINLVNNNEEAAGQTVFHAHLHLLPRLGHQDGLTIDFTTNEPNFPALAELAQTISQEVSQ
ncbi:HIT family protein [Streptococcus cuniculipharyngis]|uniref:HIT family protein n=1 Tax=Streptococcus cuniculipharyngis TaxID=1562651 RepID=A0A5C5S8V3_9STRE|nr:HIT family protein [Streptococcus cuniculipharyngis]TWS96687.1 HIT family protein [Streptococcus cuniculipharyngis]